MSENCSRRLNYCIENVLTRYDRDRDPDGFWLLDIPAARVVRDIDQGRGLVVINVHD